MLLTSADEARMVQLQLFDDQGTLTLYTNGPDPQPQAFMPIREGVAQKEAPFWQEQYQLIYVP
jgi:hypothetical protein